ncbi:serine/threonine protein kinase, putative [Talaromyces stipitatus ATCC 10500]|uniref:Serine/threonine protein kinase, putative n=1 Tax=Talaromyces stipitatus (strain ATCC 10500 / CBS 375.48 / QM 6759 / NRRL 1006) TaxID=441959 RepID=B8MFV3_TALSN|nr:serine/threonine protein kinase, putative [Talaromyces stipitatus ATCC 10500]EED15820.1 serine/threonine protein kinase, putative [Talaromyces stipitatus ATCC 10500]
MAPPPYELIGATGCRYLFKKLIQERPHLGRVWLAESGQSTFVLKDIPQAIFSSFNEDIRPRLRESAFLRLPHDTIPDQRIFVYKYMDDDFLDLVRKKISTQARKQILKASLQGIAELHSHDIVHLDIKPDNIMVNYRGSGSQTVVEQVQIIDLENAAYLPKGRCIKGMLAGNDSWRSPEAHFKGELNKPSDIFSFATVCIYAMLGQVIFGADEDLRKHESQGAFPHIIRLQRQVSYFGDPQGLNGLMTHVGDEEVNCQVLGLLWDDRLADYHSYRPFSGWQNVTDNDFKDLIQKMTNLDPQKRITAHEALKHSWFAGCEPH